MKNLDERQSTVFQKFSPDSWLGKKAHVERVIDWVTFYRRNVPYFIKHYLGINLYLYQVLVLQLINMFRSFAFVASRASAKSFLIAIFACAKCILYPNTKVVIASSTKGQAGLIITEKIQKELCGMSPNLFREILKFDPDKTDPKVLFRNGSSIVVVPANDHARGNRSTVLIFEEFRNIKKKVVDDILMPMQVARSAGYKTFPEYSKENAPELQEEPINIYISSSGTTSEWIWDLCKSTIKSKFDDDSSCLFALDYSIALYHGIKTFNTLMDAKRTNDPLTWRIEYENEMLRENANAFFSYNMIAKNQTQKKCFYPCNNPEEYHKRKYSYSMPKQKNEIRLVIGDIAFVDKKGNDNSVFTCMRLLPEKVEYQSTGSAMNTGEVKQGYRRIVPYLEANPGSDVDRQAIRIKQLFYDFEADYVVLDTRNGGILVYDRLAKVLYDEDRDKEYPPWTCMNDDVIANRVKVAGAESVVFAVNATQKLNSDIAICMRDVLTSKRIDFLINYNSAVDILNKIPEYAGAPDAETMHWYERPYLETQALIGEMIALEYEVGTQTGVFKIYETGRNTKDRYTSVSYGNWFASLLEQDLLSDQSEYDYVTFIN